MFSENAEPKPSLFQSEKDRILAESKARHERSPHMVNGVPYTEPTILQTVINRVAGVEAFVLQEQIDHAGDDPQIRCELYVLCEVKGDTVVKCVAETHAYASEGRPFMMILSVKPGRISLRTRKGEKDINL